MPHKQIITPGRLAWLIVIAALVVDQLIKVEVKTTMTIGQAHKVASWFYITFIENNGMAWGLTVVNKLFLSVMRVVVVSAIIWFIAQVARQGGRRRFVALLSLIVAGAAGNIIDSALYGLCFTASSPYEVAHAVPLGQGYAGFLMGRVVDMFYFPIIDSYWPAWVPVVGGEHFVFFSPVFNFADSCITVGVLLMLILCRADLETMGDVCRRGLGLKPKAVDGKQNTANGKTKTAAWKSKDGFADDVNPGGAGEERS